MKLSKFIMAIMVSFLLISVNSFASGDDHHGETEHHFEEAKGPNNGRMLIDGEFSLELVLFERGVPAQYRVYPSEKHKKISPNEVSVNIKLSRLGGVVNSINFTPKKDYLVGDTTITEPHSFSVEVSAKYQGKSYQWHFDSFEGRTEISTPMAMQMGLDTGIAGEQKLTQTLNVHGKLTLAPKAQRHISARFPGVITQLNTALGQQVIKGQVLMVIESNESLQRYSVYAPITGVITQQNINVGEQSTTNSLLTITDTSQLIAELNVYPLDEQKVVIGASVKLRTTANETAIFSTIFDALMQVNAQQAKVFRVKVDNSKGHYTVGQFVSANIAVDSFSVPLAVNVKALQSFRDFTVVYEKIGEQYEVRMLTLGRKAGQWVEVLSGISAGSEYVIENSYLIKADIDKAGAAHDH